jgi:UDP-N-acetyl-D-galactosamine dehydrogenase
VDSAHIPDFSPLIDASAAVDANLRKCAIVVFKSTANRGAAGQVFVPVLEW